MDLRSDFERTMDRIAAAASAGQLAEIEASVRSDYAHDERLAQLEQLIAFKRFSLARPVEDDPPADGFGTDIL
jgi:hypothetical protein